MANKSKNLTKKTVKTLNRSIPEEKFYKYLSFVLMGVMLGFTGWLIYKQYNPDVQPQLVREVERTFENRGECENYCSQEFINESVILNRDPMLSEGKMKYTNLEKKYFFIAPLKSDVYTENELEGVDVVYPDDYCKPRIMFIHADSTGLSLEDWLKVNYPDNEFEKVSEDDERTIYRVYWDTTMMRISYFFEVGDNIIEGKRFVALVAALDHEIDSYTEENCSQDQQEEFFLQLMGTFTSLEEEREDFKLLGE